MGWRDGEGLNAMHGARQDACGGGGSVPCWTRGFWESRFVPIPITNMRNQQHITHDLELFTKCEFQKRRQE